MNFNLCTIDWTAVSAIVSGIMVIITFFSLMQSKKQLKEMKRQWEAEKAPNIILSLGISQTNLFLKINNVGIFPAENVKLSINDDFYNSLPDDGAKSSFDTLALPFFIDGRSTKYIYIGNGNDLEKCFKGKDIKLQVNGTYGKDKEIHFTCDMKGVIGKKFARITDDLTLAVESIEKGISSANVVSHYQTIQKSLDVISKAMTKLVSGVEKQEEKQEENQEMNK